MVIMRHRQVCNFLQTIQKMMKLEFKPWWFKIYLHIILYHNDFSSALSLTCILFIIMYMFLKLKFLYYLCVLVYVCPVTGLGVRGQIWELVLFPSLWILGIKFWTSDLCNKNVYPLKNLTSPQNT